MNSIQYVLPPMTLILQGPLNQIVQMARCAPYPDLLQSFFLCDSLRAGSLPGPWKNGSGQYPQVFNMLPSEPKEAYQAFRFFPEGVKYKMQGFLIDFGTDAWYATET